MSGEHARAMLGGYAAKQCPYRLFREHDPTEPAVPAPPDDALQELFDDGIAFEASIGAELVRLHGGQVAVIPGRDDADPDERRALTERALATGTPIILGGLLRPDEVGRRLGEVDVLVATGATNPGGAAVYRPVDVKHHRCAIDVEPDAPASDDARAAGRAKGRVHDLRLIGRATATPGLEPRYREDDCLQLAHYYRLLQALGHAEPFVEHQPVWAGIIGSERVVAWFDLNTPRFGTITPQEHETDDARSITFHKRQRTTSRTALDRYDFEFAFRLRMVDAAARRVDRTEPPPVLPVSVKECLRCPWHDPCHADMAASDDVSLVNGVNYPEWRVHRFMGVTTCRQLAELDLTTAMLMASGGPDLPDGLDDATLAYGDTPLSSAALVKQIQNARAAVAGTLLVAPDWDPADVPRGDIEIDLDLESAEVVYLWGARLSRVPDHWPEAAGTYRAFASFEPLDARGEAALVADLWTWLDDIRRRAVAERLSVRVYGYNMAGTEGTNLRRIVAAGATPGLPSIEQLDDFIASDEWVDLLPFMRRKFWSNDGHGLKVVAVASGFSWRDEDPGGWASVGWYHDALAGVDREANIARLLAYNEDDCAATAALRDTVGP